MLKMRIWCVSNEAPLRNPITLSTNTSLHNLVLLARIAPGMFFRRECFHLKPITNMGRLLKSSGGFFITNTSSIGYERPFRCNS